MSSLLIPTEAIIKHIAALTKIAINNDLLGGLILRNNENLLRKERITNTSDTVEKANQAV